MARKWWTLITVSIATFMLLLDITIVNVALPEIERELGASLTDLQWVVDSYVRALAALTLMAGSLADRLGRKLVFTAGLVGFTTASLLAGFSRGSPTVVLFNGLGERTPSWAWVQSAVAQQTRVCTFDRAGQGWSGKAPERQDGHQLAADLHGLLSRLRTS